MKRIVIAVGLMMLPFAVSAVAQTPAPKPGAEHKKMDIWAGNWTCEGEASATPLCPAGKVSGKNSAKPILGGFFFEFQGQDKGTAATTNWVEIDGYDPVAKKYTWDNFASDGTVQRITYTIEGKKVPYSGTHFSGGKLFKVKGTIAFAPDLMSNVDKREMSLDGKAWMPFWEISCKKIKP